MDEVNKYAEKKLNRNQYGFMKNISTDECKRELIKTTHDLMFRKFREKDRPKLLFIDVKSAYDSVNRTKLYDILVKKSVLSIGSLQLLKFIHCKMNIKLGNY